MNLTDSKYKDFALVKEMLETADVMRRFDYGQSAQVAQAIGEAGKLFMTGEGSSRIFPAKNFIAEAQALGAPILTGSEGCRQAMEYDLKDFAVFGASNSGQTKEVISLFNQLGAQGNSRRFGLTAHQGTKLGEVADACFVLTCGKENAVAATKSVVEQGLFYKSILAHLTGSCAADKLAEAADAAQQAMEMELDAALVASIAGAGMIYFAGRNNGVAEELTLKTNEITRKKSDYLEGTYAVHGIEEVMDANEVVIVVDPFEEEQQKFKEVLVDGVGLQVIALAAHDTMFPTIRIPSVAGYDTVLQLVAGWNVLVHIGVANGIDLDKPVRARKVGNEFTG